MPNKINILGPEIANKIAAGEVVERPASVVKEFMENSLDAMATKIVVDIENGGLKKIKVTDNGEGILREDVLLAFNRHATSKIKDEKDLYSINTLGFRGEALPSIASVAKIILKSNVKDNIEGIMAENSEGFFKTSICSCPKGTSIEANDLFFNTPVRKKFLKTIATEFGHISNLFINIALGFPEIAFKLTHNGQTLFDLPQKQSLKERIYELLGKEIYENLIDFSYDYPSLGLIGYLVKPNINRNSRKYHYLYVNHRNIVSQVVSKAIDDAYHSLMPPNKHSIFILNMQINPLEVDVNIHPRKMEIKFLYQGDIYNLIYKACKNSLDKNDLSTKISFLPKKQDYFINQPFINFSKNQPSANFSQQNFSKKIEAESFSYPMENPVAILKKIEKTSKISLISQLNNSYILARDEESLLIIDQHAAHERLNYSRLMDEFNKNLTNGLKKQHLLSPITLELNIQQATTFKENEELLNKLGFEIENFGTNSFILRAIPLIMEKEDLAGSIISVLDDLTSGNAPKEVQKRAEYLIEYIACRSAVKFGRALSLDEQQQLLNDLENIEQKYTCPHGRPTILRITFAELNHYFKRS